MHNAGHCEMRIANCQRPRDSGDFRLCLINFRHMEKLRNDIERLYALGAEAKNDVQARSAFSGFREALTSGKIRAAEKLGDTWRTNVWVKQGILLGFRLGELAPVNEGT